MSCALGRSCTRAHMPTNVRMYTACHFEVFGTREIHRKRLSFANNSKSIRFADIIIIIFAATTTHVKVIYCIQVPEIANDI